MLEISLCFTGRALGVRSAPVGGSCPQALLPGLSVLFGACCNGRRVLNSGPKAKRKHLKTYLSRSI